MTVDEKARVARRPRRAGVLAAPRHSETRPGSFPSARAGRLTGGGTSGNERLTAMTGLLLLALLAALGITILRIQPLLSVHMFLGMLLIPPVALKMASTGYRFTRYYTGDPAYRQKGPPAPAMRLLAPAVVASTVVVFASGVALLLAGPGSRGSFLGIHKVSFFFWLAFMALHVLGHLADLPKALASKRETGPPVLRELSGAGNGRAGRILSLSGALVAGLVLGVLSISEFGPWLHAGQSFLSH